MPIEYRRLSVAQAKSTIDQEHVRIAELGCIIVATRSARPAGSFQLDFGKAGVGHVHGSYFVSVTDGKPPHTGGIEAATR